MKSIGNKQRSSQGVNVVAPRCIVYEQFHMAIGCFHFLELQLHREIGWRDGWLPVTHGIKVGGVGEVEHSTAVVVATGGLRRE